MRNEDLSTCFSVGFRERITMGTNRTQTVDSQWINILGYTPDAYQFVFPNVAMVNKAVRRFDVDPILQLDSDLIHHTFELMLEMHADLVGNCDILGPEEIVINMASSPGPNNEYEYDSMLDLLEGDYESFFEFWDFAHVFELPVYYKVSGKVELLPLRKIMLGKCRTFQFPDAQVRWCGQRLNQDFNNKFSTPGSWSGVGFDRTHGGFTTLGEELESFGDVKVETDVTEWDSRFPRIIFALILVFRFLCFKPQFQTWDTFLRLAHNYYHKAKSLMYLPSGQCLFIDIGNKSGQDSTTYDNTWGHEFMLLYNYCLLFDGVETSLHTIRKNILHKLYGDDSIGVYKSSVVDLMLKQSPTIVDYLDNAYSRFGMLLKKEECKVQKTIIGLKYLGGIFITSRYGFAHGFDYDKIRCSMAFDDAEKDEIQLWSKWVALLALSAFDVSLADMIRSRMRLDQVGFMERFPSETWYIPTQYDLYSFWFGWEAPQSWEPTTRGLSKYF